MFWKKDNIREEIAELKRKIEEQDKEIERLLQERADLETQYEANTKAIEEMLETLRATEKF